MPVLNLTLPSFPESVSVKNDCGLPWSLLIEPMSQIKSDFENKTTIKTTRDILRNVEEVERCQHCFAFINQYINISFKKWRCVFCGGGG